MKIENCRIITNDASRIELTVEELEGLSGCTIGREEDHALLDLVINLHIIGTLSEEQVAEASGLDRAAIRALADARDAS